MEVQELSYASAKGATVRFELEHIRLYGQSFCPKDPIVYQGAKGSSQT